MASNVANVLSKKGVEKVLIAIDFGYKNIKVKFGDRQILIPTLISDGSKDKIGSWEKANRKAKDVAPIDNIDNMILTIKKFTPSKTKVDIENNANFGAFDSEVDGEVIKYFGEKAKEGNNISTAFEMNARYRNRDVLLMLHATIELLLDSTKNKDYEVYLVVGLPVNHFYKQKDMTKDSILNSKVEFEWNVGGFAEKRRPNYEIADVLVLPQGATAIDMILNNHDGQDKINDIVDLQDGDLVGIIDIGEGTTDLSGVEVFLKGNRWIPKFIDTLTDGFDNGMNEVQEQLKTLFYEKTDGKSPTKKNIEDILNSGNARVSGKNYDMSSELVRAKDNACDVIVTNVKRKWRSRMNDFALFIFIGGGSVAFDDSIKDKMDEYKDVIFIPQNAIFTNVDAFYRMGKAIFKNNLSKSTKGKEEQLV